MKIIYMGTPDFAVPALKALANSEHEVCAVFTQPDKPRGRKMIMTPPDVKVCAEKLNIPVYQPETFKDGKPLEIINKYKYNHSAFSKNTGNNRTFSKRRHKHSYCNADKSPKEKSQITADQTRPDYFACKNSNEGIEQCKHKHHKKYG